MLTQTGAMALGKISLKMILLFFIPIARAASMYSFSRMDRVLP